MIRIEVRGTPAPKGSARAMMVGGRPRVIASGSTVNQRQLKSWDVALREAAHAAIGERTAPPYVDEPLRLEIEFRMRRPASHYSKAKKNRGQLLPKFATAYPQTKPDSSKLLRATEDSLNGIVFDDDARIVDTHITKRYAAPGCEGATITVAAMGAGR